MFYLALYFSSKFAITIPYLLPQNNTATNTTSSHKTAVAEGEMLEFAPKTSLRKQAAAPPTWTTILLLIPISVAVYISSTRFSDFRHHGFDIIFGSLMGILLSWASFRLYHLPIRRGSGWSWGPRSAARAWYIGVGVSGYAEEDHRKKQDLEVGLAPSHGLGSTPGNGSTATPAVGHPEGPASTRL